MTKLLHAQSVVMVYTGDGKGKTSAALGLACRALGHGSRVAFVQFIKSWQVSEDTFLATIAPLYPENLFVHKGGKGFYHAGSLSDSLVTDDEHQQAARSTYDLMTRLARGGDYDLVICDEINNAAHDGLLAPDDLLRLIRTRAPHTSLCLTGRHFPIELIEHADIVSEMTPVKHHYDDGYGAMAGIDY